MVSQFETLDRVEKHIEHQIKMIDLIISLNNKDKSYLILN